MSYDDDDWVERLTELLDELDELTEEQREQFRRNLDIAAVLTRSEQCRLED